MATTGASPGTVVRRRSARPAISVRPATPADLDTVVGMRLALWKEEARSALFADPHPDAAARARQITASQLLDDDQVFLLAISGTEAVGALRCTVTHGSPMLRQAARGFLSAAYVRPAFRRRGVLRTLVAAAEAWCRERDAHDLRLHCTPENVEGNAAWEALGFGVVEVVRQRRSSS
jgi:ribosomal protein S18 acetylase RimI-like enzyme